MNENFLQKIPCRIIGLWLAIFFVGYFLFNSQSQEEEFLFQSNNFLLPQAYSIDAIALIAMGSLSKSYSVDYSISSIRLIGKWKGAIYVLTDSPSCFDEIAEKHSLKIVNIPPQKDILHIKSLKAQMFTYLPDTVQNVLYMDVDILVARSLIPFFRDLNYLLFRHQNNVMKSQELKDIQHPSPSQNLSVSSGSFGFGAFLDARGHFVGFCSGCEKWHTGIMFLNRQSAGNCLKSWKDILLSGKFNTDQESLDFAEKNGTCVRNFFFPRRHLLFAKDYLAMIFTSGQTFIHLTAAARPEEQGYFYREIVLPRIRNSLHPPLNPAKLALEKQCKP